MFRIKKLLKNILLSICNLLSRYLSYLGFDPDPLHMPGIKAIDDRSYEAHWHYRFIRHGSRKGWKLWFIYSLKCRVEEGINDVGKIFSIRWWILGIFNAWSDAGEKLNKSYDIYCNFVLFPITITLSTAGKSLGQIHSEAALLHKSLLNTIRNNVLPLDFSKSVVGYRAHIDMNHSK